MKYKIELCPFCKLDTLHRVRKSMGATKNKKKSSGAFIKRVIYHCTKCNKRRYKL